MDTSLLSPVSLHWCPVTPLYILFQKLLFFLSNYDKPITQRDLFKIQLERFFFIYISAFNLNNKQLYILVFSPVKFNILNMEYKIKFCRASAMTLYHRSEYKYRKEKGSVNKIQNIIFLLEKNT